MGQGKERRVSKKESPIDMLARLQGMAAGDCQWDLSDNDCAAIRYALDEMAQLYDTLEAIATKGLALPIVERPGSQEEWAKVGLLSDAVSDIRRKAEALDKLERMARENYAGIGIISEGSDRGRVTIALNGRSLVEAVEQKT
jgi:hypothetical protein